MFFDRLFGRQKPDTESQGKESPPPQATRPAFPSVAPSDLALRDTLFGDLPPRQWPPTSADPEAFPWSVFVSGRERLAAGDTAGAIQCWGEVLATPDLESRHYLQAWHFLRLHGEKPSPEIAKQVLGVVVEVGMPKGLDLLAAYPDHSARYYNFSGAGVVWEHPDATLSAPIDALLSAAAEVVARIGPWDKARPAAPPAGQMRLCFLTPSGLHFGQGAVNDLAADRLGGHVVRAATTLMQMLIAKSQKAG